MGLVGHGPSQRVGAQLLFLLLQMIAFGMGGKEDSRGFSSFLFWCLDVCGYVTFFLHHSLPVPGLWGLANIGLNLYFLSLELERVVGP